MKLLTSGTMALILLLTSCKIYPPIYKRVDNFSINKLDKEGFKVGGDLIFYNPNKVTAKLTDLLMNIELNGKHTATAGQREEAKIKPRSEFAVPLNLTIKPDMSLKEGLQNLISVITKKEVEVKLDGTIVIKAYGIRLTIPVKETEKVDLNHLR